ncbi:MAG: carboxypeptidase regulatory-like domain-containing protein [Armatimonadetes bacterium]|nr:carboxypeptidase regulatory-like domain-containing protein [Armatimonadota bacterium]
MIQDELEQLRRNNIVGYIALITWGIAALAALLELGVPRYNTLIEFQQWCFGIGWFVAAVWVAVDACFRKTKYVFWTALALATGPVGVALYLLLRPVQPIMCVRCGTRLAVAGPCPSCGYIGVARRIRNGLSALMDSLLHGPIDRKRHTMKYTVIVLGITFFLSSILLMASSDRDLVALWQFVSVISGPAYWVLAAWWVYLDATWRRMDSIPWGILILATNLIGLVTYLVIRYPDPKLCAQCGAELSTGLKRCPYCGAETEPICPQCQSPIMLDWVYCPACSGKLPAIEARLPAPSTISISGNVLDAKSGSPITGATVRIDSRSAFISATSDSSGRFILQNLAPRPYVLIASIDGYSDEVKSYESQATGTTQVNFALTPEANLVP